MFPSELVAPLQVVERRAVGEHLRAAMQGIRQDVTSLSDGMNFADARALIANADRDNTQVFRQLVEHVRVEATELTVPLGSELTAHDQAIGSAGRQGSDAIAMLRGLGSRRDENRLVLHLPEQTRQTLLDTLDGVANAYGRIALAR